jgi:116 kDa U5 small nuclear ribonucleoprotein component
VAGHLHHGKSLLMDILVQHTHVRNPTWNLEKNYKWLDTRVDEQEKKLSVKATPITLLLEDFKGKHYVFNFVDTPGHPNFLGEVVAGLRMCDGVMLVIDAIEGVMLMTEKIIKHILREKLPVVVIINKVDRLIVEMKIPPEDAYLKLKHTLEEVNGVFHRCAQQLGMDNPYRISPALNNVVFAAAEYGFIFNLELMARKYQERFPAVEI